MVILSNHDSGILRQAQDERKPNYGLRMSGNQRSPSRCTGRAANL